APAHAVAATDLKVVPPVADPHAKSSLNGPGESHEKPGKDRRPENIVVAPANVPPNVPTSKPFNPQPVGKPVSPLPPPSKAVATFENPPQQQGGFRGGDEGRNVKDKKGERDVKDKQVAAQQEELRRRQFEAQQQQLQQQQQRSIEGNRGKDFEK